MSKLILADKGSALLPIAINADACEVISNAAFELAHYLKRVTGADFRILTDAEDTRLAIRLFIDNTLSEEEFVIKTSESGLTISGGTARGTLYGVFGLLEDILGIHFYTHDVTAIPSIPTLELEDIDFCDKPVLEYRQIDNPLSMYPEWRAHNRINSGGELEQYGGNKGYSLFVHTFNTLVDPEIYFDEHPEYFSMVDGVRIREKTQLCLSNPEVLSIATQNALKRQRECPDAMLISVSQNDWYNPCECPACKKMDDENESHAGSLLYFVNAIAEEIEKEFPDVVVDTLAYTYTRKPPKKIKPRHNVCVRLCSIECCFGHPLETCTEITGRFAQNEKTSDASFQQDLIGWGKICDRIYIWDYVTNYRYFWIPFPNFHVLGPNMQFFVKNSVKGVYEEGCYSSVSPDLFEMRSWLMARLLWNPDFDVKKGIFDFTEAVYGPAAPEIRAYIDLLEKRVTEGDIHFGIFESVDVAYLDSETLAKAQELISTAQRKDLTLSQRIYVEKVAFSIEFTLVAQDVLKGNVDTAHIDAIVDKARTLGITRFREGLDWNVAHKRMLSGDLW